MLNINLKQSRRFGTLSRSSFYRAAALCLIALCSCFGLAQAPYTTWRSDKGSNDSSNYSALDQINRSNVTQLEVAWKFPTSDRIEYPFDPIVVDDVAYVLAKRGAVVALNATTGKELWTYSDPQAQGVLRGLAYWESKDRSQCRILFTWKNQLIAIDAKTGQLVDSFGKSGHVDLREGLGRELAQVPRIQSTTPGRVFEDLIIMGSSTGEGYVSPPGDIRAYNVITGKLVWQFHTVPHPGEVGYDTWPKDAWKYVGGANNWADKSIDEKRGVIYIPLGAPTYDFFGGDRKGDDLFGDCLIALNARTGSLLWYFQDVHHDLWDYDLVSSPQLLTVRHDGELIDVVAQPGKNGFLWVLNRDTGKPIWPVVERPVPKSDVPGEFASPTQPFPTKPPPFARQTFTAADINPHFLTTEERDKWTKTISEARNDGIYTPPALDKFVVNMPGHSGGAALFSTSADPTNGTMYIVSFDGPALLKLEPTEEAIASYDLFGPIPSNYLGREQIGRLGDGFVAEGGDGSPASSPTTVSPAITQQGKRVYEQNCLACHGADLSGGGGGSPSLQGVVVRRGEAGVRTQIVQGGGAMPSFASLSDSSIDALLAYLKTQGTAAGSATGPRPVRPVPEEVPYPSGVVAPPRLYSAYGFAPALIGSPFSTITAYDLNTGEIKWKVPYGEAIGVGPAGNNFGILQFHGPKAGLAVTAGGLMFSATTERKIRAYDKDTGKVLWTDAIPDRSQGTPAVYEVGGREFVLIGTRGAYLAYALPEK
jgi:quinoprotein glucose dehydrogenase